MCSRCDLMVELLEQTRDGSSVVVSTFPGGTPRLVSRDDSADAYAVTFGDEDDEARG